MQTMKDRMALLDDALEPLCQLMSSLDEDKEVGAGGSGIPSHPSPPFAATLRQRRVAVRAKKLAALKDIRKRWPFPSAAPHGLSLPSSSSSSSSSSTTTTTSAASSRSASSADVVGASSLVLGVVVHVLQQATEPSIEPGDGGGSGGGGASSSGGSSSDGSGDGSTASVGDGAVCEAAAGLLAT